MVGREHRRARRPCRSKRDVERRVAPAVDAEVDRQRRHPLPAPPTPGSALLDHRVPAARSRTHPSVRNHSVHGVVAVGQVVRVEHDAAACRPRRSGCGPRAGGRRPTRSASSRSASSRERARGTARSWSSTAAGPGAARVSSGASPRRRARAGRRPRGRARGARRPARRAARGARPSRAPARRRARAPRGTACPWSTRSSARSVAAAYGLVGRGLHAVGGRTSAVASSPLSALERQATWSTASNSGSLSSWRSRL